MDSSSNRALFKYFDIQKNIPSLFREIIILSLLVISMVWIVALSSSRNKVSLIPPLLTHKIVITKHCFIVSSSLLFFFSYVFNFLGLLPHACLP
ncbi:hypothetical protein FIBSPDRAFT_515813 [Athelia psychrophila]|uniref:Uncharacterized protein n=1 Tax=Athelia psychrophila TaxID=1759441 RepID=A0A166V441_9AGAM|nr:hypothetical protein FIBSPDRAFT_515813 [Fibularhizoctonia sp. CBS 109695]